jgi:hypothetical protein
MSTILTLLGIWFVFSGFLTVLMIWRPLPKSHQAFLARNHRDFFSRS